METLTYISTDNRAKLAGRGKKLNDKSYSLITKINLILEPVIRNTLKFNKFTSVDEIYDNLIALQNSTVSDLDIEMDLSLGTIENICDALSANKGVLIKLRSNDESLYKLNCLENI